MGSPISLLLWCVVFDPVVHGVQAATGNIAMTYVDDMAIHVVSPPRAIISELCLTTLSHAVGLQLDVHHCRWTTVRSIAPQARCTLQLTTATVQPTAGGYTITGIEPDLLHAIMNDRHGGTWAVNPVIHRGPCRC
eukprot:11732158-Prorocentrum_lima.AAC.1